MIKWNTMNMVKKKALLDNIIVPRLTYSSETWTWNESLHESPGIT